MAKRKVSAADVASLGQTALKEFRAAVREALAAKSSTGRNADVIKNGRLRSIAASALVSRNAKTGRAKAKTKP